MMNKLHGAVALASLLAAYYLPDPHLLPVRAWLAPSLLLMAALGLALALRRRPQQKWRAAGLALLWLAVAALSAFTASAHYRYRQALLRASAIDPALMARLGEHLVIGYDKPEELHELARRGLIGGVFVTRRNAEGKSFEQLRAELASLQALRRQAGLPPLMIATDQEGGPVSRLSPPLPQQAALSTVLDPTLALGQTRQDIAQRAAQYGTEQARALAALGVNTNFSPVVDLKPAHASGILDLHTRIAARAIAADPDSVTLVAQAYSQASLAQGVMPTLKHFPGLGSIAADTHHFSAHLGGSLQDLSARDWRPFQLVLEQTPAMLMVGHVAVDALDSANPASVSPAVLNGLLRQQWRFNGVLISDDMSMAPIYNRGLCRSAVESLNAGMDLLLISYDWEKYYGVMDCLRRAEQSGALRSLEHSQRRLRALAMYRARRVD